MDGFWAGAWSLVKVALSTFLAFMAGELKARGDQREADAGQTIKELKTDAKNRDDVGRLDDSQLDDELRNPPKL